VELGEKTTANHPRKICTDYSRALPLSLSDILDNKITRLTGRPVAPLSYAMVFNDQYCLSTTDCNRLHENEINAMSRRMSKWRLAKLNNSFSVAAKTLYLIAHPPVLEQ
jgi:hypothetical protein